MAEKIKEKTKKTLRQLLKQKGIDAYKIIIFGSYSKGTQKGNSDIDIIVISEDFEGKDIFKRVELVNGIHSELVRKIKLPIDLMYYSISEWKKGNSLILSGVR